MTIKNSRVNLNQKLIIYGLSILIGSSAIIAGIGYHCAQKALENKEKIILENSVKAAILLVEQEYEAMVHSNSSTATAQEKIKTILLGALNDNGTRQINTPFNLGEHGYFIIYDSKGTDVMHPISEGQNAWNLVDPKKAKETPYYLVQDTISKAKSGGGYTYYSWDMPFEERIESKVTYSEYFEPWDWIITVSTYRKDFSKEINCFFYMIVLAIVVIALLGFLFSKKHISSVAKPLMAVVEAMKSISQGHYQYLEQSVRKDELGKLVSGYNEMLTAIVDRDAQLKQLAYYDPLTGLANQEKARQYVSNTGTLILIEIDRLNIIKSMYGVAYVEEILIHIANTLKQYESSQMKFSRPYGDEFSIWVEEMDLKALTSFLKALKCDIIERLNRSEYTHNLTIYMGGYTSDQSVQHYEIYYKNANVALQHAIANGIQEYVEYEKSMLEVIKTEAMILKAAEYGLQHDEFKVFYQTQVSLEKGKIVGVEALSRWYSNELGIVSPGTFIPILNQSNLICTFSEFVIRKAFEDYRHLTEKYNDDITLSINISPKLFYQENFVDLIIENLTKYHVNPKKIILEITEDLFISDFNLVKSKLERIKKYGVKISLDDFGTGYSSLNYLRNLSIDEIKIDKSFMNEIPEDNNAKSLLKSIVDIAHTLDFWVVVEGVENQAQVDYTKEIGCEVAQGFYFSKPEPLS